MSAAGRLARLLLLPCLAMLGVAAAAEQAQVGALNPGPRDRILVVAPHPDDETLCCAGVLQRAASAGARVGIVWVTAGDGARFNALLARVTPRSTGKQMVRLGKQRINEAAAAATVLGVPVESVYFLGFPDRGLRWLLDPAGEEPFRSSYTRRSEIPYSLALSTDEPVTAALLHADLTRVMQEFRPTWVLAPALEDMHPDHRATGMLVRQVMEAGHHPAGLASYVIHGGRHWPGSRGLNPELELSAAPALAGLDWISFDLTLEERRGKAEALREHRSQMRRMSRFLNSFVRSNELFLIDRWPAASGAPP